MLKDRLHEGQVPPQEEKAQHKEKVRADRPLGGCSFSHRVQLQQWLRESALEKEHKMREVRRRACRLLLLTCSAQGRTAGGQP